MNKQNDIEIFLDKLGILSNTTYFSVCENKNLCNKIINHPDEMNVSISTLLNVKNHKNKIKFFLENINVFECADIAIVLWDDINNTFSISPSNSFDIVLSIFNQNTNAKNYIQNIFEMLKRFLNISDSEIKNIISQNPQFLKSDMKQCYNNFSTLTTKFHVSNEVLKQIFNICPLFFAKNDILPTIQVIKKMLNLDKYELDYLLSKNYSICLLPIKVLRENLSSLIHIFELYDLVFLML